MIEHNRRKIANIENLIQGLFSDFESKEKTLFKDVFQTFNGYSFKSNNYVESSKYKLITIKNITDFGFNTDKTFFLKKEDIDKKFELKPGDIILTMTGNIGRTGIVDEKYCFLNQRVLKLDCVSKAYLHCYVKKYKGNIINLGKGTAQQNLSIVDLKSLIVKNSLNEIDNFKKYDTFFEIILNLKMQIKELNNIKKILLDKYFTNQQ